MTLIEFNSKEDRDKAIKVHKEANRPLRLEGKDNMQSHNGYDRILLEEHNIGYYIKLKCR